MRLRAFEVAGCQDEVEVLQQIRPSVNHIEVITARTRDDAHEVFAVQRLEDIRDAIDDAGLAAEQLTVTLVALVPQPLDLVRLHALRLK